MKADGVTREVSTWSRGDRLLTEGIQEAAKKKQRLGFES